MNLHQFAETHDVTNQPPSLDGTNLYRIDLPLQEWSRRFGAGWAETRIDTYGALAGGPLMAAGFLANENKPVFSSHDRYGHRIDLVEFHPAYHELMRTAVENGLPSLPWAHPQPGAHVARAAMTYLHSQAEAGTGCPLTMTFASVPALQLQPDLADIWLPKILATTYDPRNVGIAHKAGATIGMAMTEKQGGTDVRANTTRAYPVGAGGPGQAYELVGHKWFCSAPMCDAFLTLAQTDKGLTCFLLPRHRPDDTRNAFYIQRLKNKLGNCSNASSEVEFRGALAWMIGEEGRGVPTIIEMVAMTRFDCMVGSSALMRQALTQASHHCAHRLVGGRVLSEQPLMQNVLADLALESEASLALSLRMGRALDQLDHEQEAKFARLVTAVGKYWICKRAPAMINEAAECMGGAGYVEDSILPRLYREAPVNSTWEGSGNVQCLDVLRALSKEPGVLEALFVELGDGHGDKRLGRHIEQLKLAFMDTQDIQYRARQLTEDIAVALQAKLLLEAGNAAVSDGFIASRLGESSGRVYGTLPRGVDVEAIVARSHIIDCIPNPVFQWGRDTGKITACTSEHRMLTVTEAFVVVQTAEEAVDRLAALHERATGALNQALKQYLKDRVEPDAAQRAMFRYPELRLTYLVQGEVPQTTRAYAKVQLPGTYSVTVTHPAAFRKYLLEQLVPLMHDFTVTVEVGVSQQNIPYPYVVEQGDELAGSGVTAATLARVFPSTDLSAATDGIADGLYDWENTDPLPLALFDAARVDFSLRRLVHYTGSDWRHVQPWILLTNYHRYVDQFIVHGLEQLRSDPRFVRMVLPGNVVIEKSMDHGEASAIAAGVVWHRYQMPAYHLQASDGHGVTLVNIGVGPSNAKNITDHLAVLRPHCWLMIGHCGGLRQSQTIGDYVLAHAYMRRDGILDRVVPPNIPIPALAEVQMALQQAAANVTGEKGEELKKRLRTGTVLTYDDRNWELRWAQERPLINLSRAVAVDMESGTIAAQGYRLRVPYGTLLCVSDKPLHSEIKLPGSANAFYERAVSQHLKIGIEAVDLLRTELNSLHSRKLRSFDEPPFR